MVQGFEICESFFVVVSNVVLQRCFIDFCTKVFCCRVVFIAKTRNAIKSLPEESENQLWSVYQAHAQSDQDDRARMAQLRPHLIKPPREEARTRNPLNLVNRKGVVHRTPCLAWERFFTATIYQTSCSQQSKSGDVASLDSSGC